MMDDDKDAWLDEVKQWVFGNQLPAHMRSAPAQDAVPVPVVAPAVPERGEAAVRSA
ncbi:hypothetical protein [Ideonella dechloratans]|uniref:hypothetical protein n=2 Tax=Ideonella dechloratans TaxID=36863 RepID=UPI001E4A9355|nr:hypothetical protein [Ideonella dechloratans]